MKTLMTLILVGDETYAKAGPVPCAFSSEENQPEEPCDWREDLRLYAHKNGFTLQESDLVSVASMVDFMIANSPIFKNGIRRSDVLLPGGAVLLDSTSSGVQAPLVLMWEEDAVSEVCSNCCKFHRKACTGKCNSQLVSALSKAQPECFEECPEDSCPYGPGLCDICFENLPDGFEVEDAL